MENIDDVPLRRDGDRQVETILPESTRNVPMINHRNSPTTARRTRRRPKPRGFTLVELLAVVAIIGILIALLLPAVQASREAARRSSCSNNTVQLILAMHHYESTHQVYPPGTVDASGPIVNQPKGYHHGWIEQLLPYLEKEAVYHQIDRDLSVYDKQNMPLRKIGFSWLRCPSSPQGGEVYSNYAALHHNVEAPIDVDQNGIFFLNSAVAQEDVSDGLGYTIFLGEKVLEAGDLGWLSGTSAILRNTGEAINTAMTQRKQARRWGSIPQYPPGVLEPGSGSSLGDGSSPAEDVYDPASMGGESGSPAGTLPGTAGTFVGGFASFHPGGANFAMGDGSTRFLYATMSMRIYQQMGHRSDGELINIDESE